MIMWRHECGCYVDGDRQRHPCIQHQAVSAGPPSESGQAESAQNPSCASCRRLEGELDQATDAIAALNDAKLEIEGERDKVVRQYREISYVSYDQAAVVAKAQAQIAALREALRTYGQHKPLCAKVGSYQWECNCGLFAALAPDLIPVQTEKDDA